ncbi:DNA-binding Lrp family transcriptional regulator [Microbacterium resistens]|uniref:DNA-binding Lrp family transcriptional regulator n=1 Tax=Microbacterium resistens TaxID=156977 RepID=A0ABU1S7R5_9MICO|nr:AsnC family transcriptional regulator [Microbacterium resistens]MDR6865661.1 DNA-binding Lrp family transcriptional regulator [Microbacterium resistens]
MSSPSNLVDEDDLSLVEALQLSPRATWRDIGRSLGIETRTARRRWARLRDEGLAWIACTPGPASPAVFAHIQIACAPGDTARIAAELVERPRFVTVQTQGGGSYGLLALAVVPRIEALNVAAIDDVSTIPGIQAHRVSVVTRIFRQGADWRVGALDEESSGALAATRRPPDSSRGLGPAARRLREPLLALLNEDGRMSVRRVAERLGESEPTARRALADLLGAGHLLQRCEVSHAAVGRPVDLVLWLSVSPERLGAIAHELSQQRVVRVCVAIVGGESNLLIQCWLRGPDEIPSVERFVATIAGARIVERGIILRHYKRFNHVLDDRQRTIRIVSAPGDA